MPYCAGVSAQWTIHGEKLVDENRHIRLSTVDIILPDGVAFTQYVVAMPPAAMIERGEIVGASTVVAVYRALTLV